MFLTPSSAQVDQCIKPEEDPVKKWDFLDSDNSDNWKEIREGLRHWSLDGSYQSAVFGKNQRFPSQ